MTQFEGHQPSGEAVGNRPGASTAGHCETCGSPPHDAGQSYCGSCGSRLARDAPADGSLSTWPALGQSPSEALGRQPSGEPQAGDRPYSGGATVGALLLSLIMPV